MNKELGPVQGQPPSAFGRPFVRWKIALRHPAARLPLAIGVTAALVYLFLSHTALFLALSVVGLLFGAGAGFLLSSAGNRWVATQLEGRSERLALDVKREEHDRLKRALSKLKWEAPVENQAEQAIGQLEQLQTRFDLFEKALRAKMTPGELTYERYHSTAASVRNAVLQNLHAVATSLQSLLTMSHQEEALRGAETSKLQALYAGNEQALLRLMEAAQALNDIKTSRDSASVNLEATLKDLKDLAARASKY